MEYRYTYTILFIVLLLHFTALFAILAVLQFHNDILKNVVITLFMLLCTCFAPLLIKEHIFS